MTPTPQEIAARLSEAQRRAVLADDFRAPFTSLRALRKRGLISFRQCFPDGEGIVFTPLGQQVRTILETPDVDAQ